MLVAVSCSSDGPTALAVNQVVPTAQPTSQPLPTTEPVLVPPDPVPTPITLSGGQGIAAPAAGSDADGDDYNDSALADEAATDESTSEQAADAEQGDDSTSEQATGDQATDDQDDESADGYNEAAVAGSDTSDPEPTPAPEPTAAPAATSAAAPAATPAPAPIRDVGSAQSIANGAEVYALQCARCHGAAGEGVISRPLLFIGSRYNASTMVNELTNGHPFTFGFADKLSPTEISNVVDFVLDEFG